MSTQTASPRQVSTQSGDTRASAADNCGAHSWRIESSSNCSESWFRSTVYETTMKFPREDIEVLSGIEAVRRRPAMYVGALDNPTVPNHLLQEMLCVAID